MEILYLLIGCSVLVAAVFLGGFLWSVKSGQYEDVYTPAIRILFDETASERKSKKDANEKNNKDTDTVIHTIFPKNDK